MTATNTAAAATVAHYDFLATKAQELLTKNTKKNGLEKITVQTVDGVARTYPNLIQIKEGFNFRDLDTNSAKEGLKELAASIIANGVLQPIVLFKEGDVFYAEDGHRRLAAVDYAIRELNAEILTVPVRISPKNTNETDRIFSQYILNSGEKPTALETAGIFARLIKLGWTEKNIQEKTGYSKTRVTQILELNALPAELHVLIRTSDIEVKPSFVHERFVTNGRNGDKTVEEIKAAIDNARELGYDRATNKHLPESALPGMAARRQAPKPDATPPAPAPAAQTTPEAERAPVNLKLVPGAPAPANLPAPPAGAAPEGNAAPQRSSNSEFRRALTAYFSALVVNGFERDGKSIPSFEAGKFIDEAQWICIRDNLGL